MFCRLCRSEDSLPEVEDSPTAKGAYDIPPSGDANGPCSYEWCCGYTFKPMLNIAGNLIASFFLAIIAMLSDEL
jgi:hypothetical protein